MTEVNARPAGLVWASPDDALWVASADSEYAGMIEFRDGHFVASDSRNRVLGSFSDLPRARDAVNAEWQNPTESAVQRVSRRFLPRLGRRDNRQGPTGSADPR